MHGKHINCFGGVNPFRGRVFRMNTTEAKSKSLIRFPEKLLEIIRIPFEECHRLYNYSVEE